MPEKLPLIALPTPLHPLPRLSADLGIELWIKRDDLTGLALGGNKGRKLEYLMAEAIASGADTVVSCGALQSNFVRQLGAACSMLGLQCAVATMELPYPEDVGRPEGVELLNANGNFWIDQLVGVDVRVFPDADWDVLEASADAVQREYEAKGHKVFRIAIGGSSPLGAYSFYQAGLETTKQAGPFDFLITPCSSGSTHSGLAYAFHNTPTHVIGISADPMPDLADDVHELCGALDDLTGESRQIPREAIDLRLNYVGPGYGVTSPDGNAAMLTMLRREGILLDPIYSGKAFAGLLNRVEQGEVRGRVLFWHTGGAPTLFAMPTHAFNA